MYKIRTIVIALKNLDFDLDGLHKLKKSVKLLYEAGQEWHRCEQDLVVALDQIAGLNASNSFLQEVEPDISKKMF